MAEDKIDKLEQKKRELQKELDNLQQELDDSIDKVRTDVSSRLDPSSIIKKHPIPAVGLSILVGFLAGSGDRKNRSESSGSNMKSILWDELKKIGTKKVISLVTDYTEKILLDKKDELFSSSPTKAEKENGSVKKD